MLCVSLALAGAPAAAQTWTLTPTLSLRETVTNNVNLSPTSSRESDLVTDIQPALTVLGRGSRTNLRGFVSVPILLYARTGAANNSVYPTVDLTGDMELVDRFFYVDGAVSVAQQFFNPFGAQPSSLASATQNRFRTDTYRISPFIRGVTQGNISYELRNNNVWNNLSGAPINVNNTRYTQFTGTAGNPQAQLGWRAFFDYVDTRFSNQNSTVTRLVRLTPLYNVNAQWLLSGSVGYEDNDFQLTSSKGAIYGLGFTWRPTPRTNVAGDWEHRFFGAAYNFSFDHRTQLSAWNVTYSRNITTYPQQLATLPAGANVQGFLNSLFLALYPDPAARQQAIDQFIADRGLPSTTANPVSLYAQQILLQESFNATVGLIGARNSLYLTIYNVENSPIAGSGTPLPGLLAGINDNTQTGGSVTWTHQLTPAVSLVASTYFTRTEANPPQQGKTNQGTAYLAVTVPLSARTKFLAGAAYQALSSDVAQDYNETSAFVGINHTFR